METTDQTPKTTPPAGEGVPPKQNKICPECGKEFSDFDGMYCPSCTGKKGGRPRRPPQTPPPDTPPLREEPPILQLEPIYRCDVCNHILKYAQRKCPECSVFVDWRGSPVESDPEIVICPECGAVCGYTEDSPTTCPHCSYSG